MLYEVITDTAVLDPETGAYPTSRPLGDINDGKLYPFKYKTATQPMITKDKKLLALDTLEYRNNFVYHTLYEVIREGICERMVG